LTPGVDKTSRSDGIPGLIEQILSNKKTAMNDEIAQTTNDATILEPQTPPPPPSEPPSKIRSLFCWLEDHHSVPHWATAVFTLLLAGVAVGLVVFAKHAFEESQKTTEALERQIQEMRDEERPWIGLQSFPLPPLPRFNEDYVVQLSFANGGKTPAFNVRANFTLRPLPAGSYPDIPSEPCREAECGGGELSIPNAPITRRFGLAKDQMTGFTIHDVAEGRSVIWLVGRIDYEEMARLNNKGIKEATRHKTLLCYNIDWTRPAIATFRACTLPHSNDAD
jgi:hypothetical protein